MIEGMNDELHALPHGQRVAITRHRLVEPAQILFSRLFVANHPLAAEAEVVLHKLMWEVAQELGYMRPWMTINEARARDNLPPLDGSDELRIPIGLSWRRWLLLRVRSVFRCGHE